MHPVLLKLPLPKDFLLSWGPKAKIASNLYIGLFVVGLVLCIGIAWWGLSPDGNRKQKITGIVGAVGALVFALLLGGIGLGRLQFIQLHTYGVLVAIGFLIGIVLAVREANRIGANSEQILDLAFWLLIAAMVGARLGYILTHWQQYITNFKKTGPWYQWKIFRLWEGGLLFFGGLVLAILVCWVFVRIYKIDFWKLADILVPSLAIGQVFGQLGSLAAGFGYGKITTASWGIMMTAKTPMGDSSLHPTQLYEALAVLALFFLLLWVRSNKKYNGQVFLWYLLIYPIISFGIEIFRGDACLPALSHAAGVCRAMIFERDLTKLVADYDILSWSQLFAVVLVAVAIVLFFVRRVQVKSAPQKTA